MKRTIFVFYSLFLLIEACYSQNTLNIIQKSGDIVSYGFSEKPVITRTGEELHVSTISVSVDFPLSNVQRLTFEDNPNSIDELRIEKESTDLHESSGLYIYNTNGLLLKKVNPVDGIYSYSIQDLPSGIYIIKNGTTTMKVAKK